MAHATADGKPITIVKDIGSGMNCDKPGLRQLLRLLLSGTVAELVLTSKDCLLRFGSELLFFLYAKLGVKVTILDPPTEKSMEATVTQDVLAVLTVFSATLYGARSHRPKASPLAA